MTRLAASMVQNFVDYLDGVEDPEPEPAGTDKQKDVTSRKSLAEVFNAALAGGEIKETEGGQDFYGSLSQTLKDLGW